MNLQVPYFSQHDNESGCGYRECFSSSCAMLAAYWGSLNSDDLYNSLRVKYGDSTDPLAQVNTLKGLGLTADFTHIASISDLRFKLAKGLPVAVGWLHHGNYQHPTGGGHWSVARGYDETGLFMNDPNGEADLVNGGYLNTAGANLHYSYKHWLPRWEVEGEGSGWMLTCHPRF